MPTCRICRSRRWATSPGLVLVLVLLLHPGLTAQSGLPLAADPLVHPWSVRTYPNLAGLGLTAITRDREGAYWFATDAGVKRYDGVRWQSWSIADGLLDARIISLCVLGDGSLVAGSRRGICRFRQGRWQPLLLGPTGFHWRISAMVCDRQGSLWAATRWGVLHRRQGRWILHTSEQGRQALGRMDLDVELRAIPDRVLSWSEWRKGIGMKMAATGDTWFVFALAEGGPAMRAGIRLGDRVLSLVPLTAPPAGRPRAHSTFRVTCQERDGNLRTFKLQAERLSGSHADIRTGTIAVDRKGMVWAAPIGTRLWRCSPRGGGTEWTTYDLPNPQDQRSFFCTDGDGRLLVSTIGRPGISAFDGERFSPLPGSETIKGGQLVAAGGRIWVLSTRSGPHSWCGGRIRRHGSPPGQETPRVALATPDGHLWLGDHFGRLALVDLDRKRIEAYERLNHAASGDDGTDWFLDRRGRIISRHQERWHCHDSPTLASIRFLNIIALAGGRVAACGLGKGRFTMVVREGDSWRRVDLPSFQVSFTSSRIGICGRDGSLWLGPGHDRSGRRGLLHGNEGNWQWVDADQAKGMGRSMVEVDGRLWLVTSRGLFHQRDGAMRPVALPDKVLQACARSVCTDTTGRLILATEGYGFHIRKGDNWQVMRTNDHALDYAHHLCRADGGLWATTRAGLCRYDGWMWYLVLPWQQSQGIKIHGNGASVWVSSERDTFRYTPERTPPRTMLINAPVRLSAGDQARITWTGHDPWQPDPGAGLTWSYRLDGEPWSRFTTTTHLELADLPRGRHSIRVRTRDRDFNVDPRGASWVLTVVSPVWQEPWFIGLILVSLLLILVQSVRVVRRGRRLSAEQARAEAAEKARERIQREVLAREKAEREHRRLEIQLMHARKMEAIGELAGGVAHDFNNILTAISGHVSLLGEIWQEEGRRDPEIGASLEGIGQASRRAVSLTQQLLAVGRRQAARPVVIDPNRTISELAGMLDQLLGKQVRLEMTLTEEAHPIRVDRSMFEQIIMNLVVNARDAMPAGGQIDILTDAVVVGTGELASQPECRPGLYFLLAIGDEGVGMDEDTLSRIFEPFFTTKEEGKGTGLGLSTIFGIVRQSGGFLTVDSTPDKGSTFQVFLPVHPEPDRARPAAARTGGTILVCDPDQATCQAICGLLEQKGHSTTMAADRAGCLAELARPDLEVNVLVTALHPHLEDVGPPTIYLAPGGDDDPSPVGVISRCHGVLTRPVHRRLLFEQVSSALCLVPPLDRRGDRRE